MKRILTAFATALTLLPCLSPAAEAAVVVSILETGDDVLVSASGSFTFSGAAPYGLATGRASLFARDPSMTIGTLGVDQYAWIWEADIDTAFGTGGLFTADNASGTYFGFSGTAFWLDDDYVSGSAINSTALFQDSSFFTMRLAEGAYTYALPIGDSLTLAIGQEAVDSLAAVPLPATGLLLAGAIGALSLRRKRHNGPDMAEA